MKDIQMNFNTTTARCGDNANMGVIRAEFDSVNQLIDAHIDIYLINGLPLEWIIETISHEVLHWTIYMVAGKECFRDSEPIVRDMMNTPQSRTVILDGKY